MKRYSQQLSKQKRLFQEEAMQYQMLSCIDKKPRLFREW